MHCSARFQHSVWTKTTDLYRHSTTTTTDPVESRTTSSLWCMHSHNIHMYMLRSDLLKCALKVEPICIGVATWYEGPASGLPTIIQFISRALGQQVVPTY